MPQSDSCDLCTHDVHDGRRCSGTDGGDLACVCSAPDPYNYPTEWDPPTKLRPAFKYWGSKVTMAKWAVDLLPHHEHFAEVCAGSAAMLAYKDPTVLETVNDVDGDVVNFFRVVRDPAQRQQLIEAVAFTAYSREEFRRALDAADDLSCVERALAFLIRMNQAVVPGRTGWSYTSSPRSARGQRTTRWASLPGEISKIGMRFERVQVESLDAVDFIARYDKVGVLLFIDPPYLDESRPTSTGTSSGYSHEFDLADHERLIEAVTNTKYASAAITHYPHEMYDALGWSHYDYGGYKNVANQTSGEDRRQAVERLYILDRSGATDAI